MQYRSPQGSNWIKCDLHVHTPASFCHQYGDRAQDATWDKFINDLEKLPPEFKVIGINDYLTIDGYKTVRSFKEKGRLANITCILPVVEFRINRFAGESKTKRINYHVIFSDSIDTATITSQFLNALSAEYTLEEGSSESNWSGIISEDSFIELGDLIKRKSPQNASLQSESSWQVGFNNFNVDYDHLKRILDRPVFRGKIIKAIGKSEWDEYRWDAGGAADKRTIINEADIVFLSSDSVSQHEKNKKSLSSNSVNSLLLDCSDAHHYSTSPQKDRIGNCYTWLKIEPSFEGVQQILFEPEGRISISETHPDKKSPYQVIQSVRFLNSVKHFTDSEIHFSPYLNSIIGGKSTGKSLLAGLIVKSSDLPEYKKRKGEQKNSDDLEWIKQKEPDLEFEVTWKDGIKTRLNDGSVVRKITYFPQHYLNSKINDKGVGNKELNKIIRVILSQTTAYAEAFENYEAAVQLIDLDVSASCTSLESKIKDLRQLTHATQEKGISSDIRANIEKLQIEFSELKTQFGLTEEELNLHQTLAENSKILEEKKSGILVDVGGLSAINKDIIKSQLLPEKIFEENFKNLSCELVNKIVARATPLITSMTDSIHTIITEELGLERGRLGSVQEEITDAKTLHAPILEKIKNSAPLREKSTLITQEQKKLEDVILLEEKISALQQEIILLKTSLMNYVENKLDSSQIVISRIKEQPFSSGDDQLGIEIAPRCKADHIQGILKDRIKYQSNPQIRAFIGDDEFSDDAIDSYVNRVDMVLSQAIIGTIEPRGDHKISGILQELLSNSLYLNYDLKLGQDSFSIMSPGKRALALLRVLIELDTSQHPIVLDQPEDDLDNRSIYEGLATYIKAKKNSRQIIVVTHNPNVVVGSDSEYVIVANQSGQESNQNNRNFRFEYVYGGLENSFSDDTNPYVLEKKGIRQHVCEILDGGETAFQRREQLYSGSRKRRSFKS